MAMPAMAPEERLEWWVLLKPSPVEVLVGEAVGEEVGEELDEDVDVGTEDEPVEKGSGVLSDGQGSLGWSMKVEFSASCFWREREVEALGLMTPIMP